MSPRFLVSLSFICLCCSVIAEETDSTDVTALRSLRKQWKNTPPNWVKRNPCGRKWEGVVCSDSRVTALILPGINLMGSLPEEILSLSELQTLDLSNNQGLYGPLPSNIGSLKNLVNLILIACNFSGRIPQSIGSLPKLKRLFLNYNKFTGSIPHSIGNLSNIVWLDLSGNQLDGTIPVSNNTTPGLDLLLKAKHFHFGQNRLSGEIPLELFSSSMSLIHVIFNDNQLIGSIPDTLGLVPNLEVIRFDANLLSGLVPKSLKLLSNVSELYLSNNNLSDEIPDLTGMDRLTYVDLSNNSFRRSGVPPWFETLPNLTTLIMENTGLEGPVSTGLFSLPRLQTVRLRNNQLNGSLEIGTSFSSDLRLVDLQNNSIDGFNAGQYKKKVVLDNNPFCRKQEASGICNNDQEPSFSNFEPPQYCAPLACFSGLEHTNCSLQYLGSLVFRSFNFSDLSNLFYYRFLTNSLQPLFVNLTVPVEKMCLVSSSINTYGYLVLNIAFFPPGGPYFNRTGIASIGHVLNNQFLLSPYGPYYFKDQTYSRFPQGSRIHTALIIGLSISGFVLAVVTVFSGVYAHHQRKRARKATKLNDPFSSWNEGKHPQLKGVRCFTFEDVKHFTDNFSPRSEIGSGGYGKVYKGKLDSGELVAIKRAKQGSLQGALEFKTEIEGLSRVHHKNVVNLLGFCYDEGEQMLVYEYIPNGSLRATLLGKLGIWLNWPRRLNVALGAARGLAYLHELADPPIIHRDIKSDNILLDNQLNAKVADFGLCKTLSYDREHVTTQVKGTMGYLDPQYCMTEILSEKSDVYSFGVVMLELVTGRLAIQQNVYVLAEVKAALEETGNINDLVDPSIISDTMAGVKEFVDIAMSCVQDTRDRRPSMSEVVKKLEGIIESSDFNVTVNSSNSSASYGGNARLYSQFYRD